MDGEYSALIAEIDPVGLSDRHAPGACELWSIKDILGHLDAWHSMFLIWEKAGAAGESVEMPAPGYTWKDTPALNDRIYTEVKDDLYDEIVGRLDLSHQQVRAVLMSYSDDDLFTKKRFTWTGSTSVGSYAVSATSSHYNWARKLIRRFKKTLAAV